jgi:hypothetical protein
MKKNKYTRNSKILMSQNKEQIYKEQISKVTLDVLLSVIETNLPLGLFYAKDISRYVGVDNRNGEAWTKLFRSKCKCKKWLRGYN